MSRDDLDAVRDYYNSNDQSDEITAAFEAGAVTYHDPRSPETLIYDLIHQWHAGANLDDDADYLPLHEFLGMTWEQYGRWVELKMPADELAEWAKTRQQ